MADDIQQKLQQQIDERRQTIHADQYSMSIGELANLYRDGELDIHPEFQRLYRWSDAQKSKFVESILLRIPIPSIFVAQRKDGKWDLIDGLQRLSTIFELMGELLDEQGNKLPPLTLMETKYLKDLDGVSWVNTNKDKELSSSQKLEIKRSKLDIKILLEDSDVTAKFELFQRLNTGGSQLSLQEIRNAMLVASNPLFYKWLESMSQFSAFRDCVTLTERNLGECYDMELVLRFIVFRKLGDFAGIKDLGSFLTKKMEELVPQFDKIKDEEKSAFENTFRLIFDCFGDNAFKRYETQSQRFIGGFLISAYEAVALGIGFNPENLKPKEELDSIVKNLWNNTTFTGNSGSGISASTRISRIVPLGRNLFTNG